jgi:hypothetical protein
MDIAHELGHALSGIALGGKLTYFKIAFFEIYPNPSLTTTFELGQVEMTNLGKSAFGVFLLYGSLTTNVIAWLIGLLLLKLHFGNRTKLALKIFGLLGILDLPLYVLFPQIGLQHWVFLGGNSPEPLVGARNLGIPDLAFYIAVAFTTLGLILLYFVGIRNRTEKSIAEFIRRIRTSSKQWTTSTSPPSFYANQKPENPEKSVPSQADPKNRPKTPINHANHRYLEGVEE